MANNRLQQEFTQLNLVRRATWLERFLKYGGRDAAILFAGGLALVALGVVIWCIGASWLVGWIDGFATSPDKKMGWLGWPIQLFLTIVELAIMLKLSDNKRMLAGLAVFVALDAGTNTAGTNSFLFDLIAHGKFPMWPLLVMWLVVTVIVAFLTYGPEKAITWGAEMAVEGYRQLSLVFAAIRLSIEKEEEEDAKRASKGPQQKAVGWTVIRGNDKGGK